MNSWLEVSLTVDGELAEAVADVFARFAPSGVTTEQGVGYVHAEDEGTPMGLVTVRAYLTVDEKLEETRQELEESLYYLGMIKPLPVPTFTPIADQNWMEAWKENYRPIPIGNKLIIIPAWLESPDAARIPIKIDPGMAFGTGTHPTTQLCLEFIEEIFEYQSAIPFGYDVGNRLSVIDVGCGSGILSIAVIKLGGDYALGVDIDDAAVNASRENAQANGVPEDKFALGVGSVTEVLDGRFPIKSAPLVLANILAPVLVRLFESGMARLVAPNGALVLSGILEEQAESVIASAQANGLHLESQKKMGDWVALLVKS